MFKKLIMSCTALVALAAFALPAVASAANDPQLTSEGKLVSVGTSVIGTASNITFTDTNGASLILCSVSKLTGTVKKNSSSTVEYEIPLGGATASGTGTVSADNGLSLCTGSSLGNFYTTVKTALCFKADPTMAEDEFQMSGAACGSIGKEKFILGFNVAGECEYEATGNVKGGYTTNGTQANLTTVNTSAGSGFKLIKGGFLCLSSFALRITYGLETANGTAVTIS